MTPMRQKIATLTLLTLIPAALILVKYFLYYRRGWHEPEIQMQLIFWLSRGLLIPFLILSIVKFWSEFNEALMLALKVIVGFIFFLILHISTSFILLKVFLTTSDDRNWNLYNTIRNESLSMNILTYLLSVIVVYAWNYFERLAVAKEELFVLESELSVLIRNNEPIDPTPQPKGLLIKSGTKTTIIPIATILFIQSDGPYVKIVSDQGKFHLLQRPLYQVEKELFNQFIRIHRSKLVRRAAIKEIKSLKNGDFVLSLTDGSEHRGSRTFKETLITAIG